MYFQPHPATHGEVRATTSARKKKHRRKSGHVRPKAPIISLDEKGRLGTAQVLAISNWSDSTLRNRIAAGQFPAPKKDGRFNYWTTNEAREALGCELLLDTIQKVRVVNITY